MSLIEREPSSPAGRKAASLAQAFIEVQRFIGIASDLRYLDSLRSKEILDRVELARAAQVEEARLRKLIERLAKPATLKEIGEAVFILQAAYPGRDGWDLATWARCLREDIAELSPSLFQLERAMKEARQKFKFPPTIAEVLPLFKSKCLAAWASNFPPLAKLIEDATNAAGSRRELEAMPRHTPSIAKPMNRTMAARSLANCADMCGLPDFDPSDPMPELTESERELVAQIAEELLSGAYNRCSPARYRCAALHIVHKRLTGA